jgi:hypothetical protein
MKRHLVFAGDYYYPSGGWNDFLKGYDLEEEAISAANSLDITEDGKYDWWHVVDFSTQKIILASYDLDD